MTQPTDPVTAAVSALRAFSDRLDPITARQLLAGWKHRRTLSRSQVEEVVLVVSVGGYYVDPAVQPDGRVRP